HHVRPGPPGAALPIGRRRVVARGESKGRRLSLPDDLHDRLWLTSRQERTTVGAVATGILDRHRPRLRIKGIAQIAAKSALSRYPKIPPWTNQRNVAASVSPSAR